MKKTLTLFSAAMVGLLLTTSIAMAQSGNVTNFRKGYMRLGFHFLGNSLDEALSPTENILAGNLGASRGYALEVGKAYYFNNDSSLPLRYGLDWTVLSLSFNMFDWEDYVAEGTEFEGGKFAAGISSKLGPVVSFNPVEKLIIDARVQIAPQVYFYDFGYYNSDDDYFSFTNDEEGSGSYVTEYDDANGDGIADEYEIPAENYDPEKVMSRLFFGIKPSFGVTIRRNALGLALDYSPGKIKTQYSSNEGHGEEKVDVSSFHIKLSLTL